MSKDEFTELVLDILQELYQHAEPPLNFKPFFNDVTSGKVKDYDKSWYSNHYIPAKKEESIVADMLKGKELNKIEKFSLNMYLLNWSPSNVKK